MSSAVIEKDSSQAICQVDGNGILTWIGEEYFERTVDQVSGRVVVSVISFLSIAIGNDRDFSRIIVSNRCCDRRVIGSDFVLCRSCDTVELWIRDRNLELLVRFNEIRKVGQAASTLRESIILKRVQFDIERWRGVPNAGAAVAIPSNGCAIKLKTSRCTCCRCRGS